MRKATRSAASADHRDRPTGNLNTIRRVLPYLWPDGQSWVKRRVVGARSSAIRLFQGFLSSGWMERSKPLAALQALAHQTRLDLVRLLMPCGAEGMAAGAIGASLGLAASHLSFHLSALEQAGLIRARRASRNVIYEVDLDGMGRTIAYLLCDCCGDHPQVLACCQPPVAVSPALAR